MITVTGATGQLGRLIIEQLLEQVDADQIVAVARTPEKAAGLADNGVVVRQGDYDDPASLALALADTDVLMFISNTDVAKRSTQHQNVVDAARQVGVGRVVYTSAVNIEGENPVVAGHRNTERMIKGSGMTYTFLRPNLYMDMYVVEVEIAISVGAYRSAAGGGGASFISRADIARAAAAVLVGDRHANKVYELTGPTAVTAADFARVASEISGKAISVEPITFEQLADDYRGRGMPEAFIPMSVGMERTIATNALAKVSNDIDLITGEPAEDFTSFLRKSLGK